MHPAAHGDRLPGLAPFHPAVAAWFARSFPAPTPPQALGWPVIASGDSALVLAPTGTGKTLAAFLWCIDRLMFSPVPQPRQRCRVVYVSPLKALAVDVERNLRAPIAGITRLATDRGDSFHVPAVAVRTGDTPASERSRFQREPTDILITTPESLYLLLTSRASDVLRSVDTLILDEIHALVPTKRGAHLALSVERLEHLTGRRLQRIGLSATQRPLDEVAKFLGGTDPDAASRTFRPVTTVDAGSKKALDLRLEVPVEDMARLDQPVDLPSGPAAQGPVRPSIWTAIHPRLLELIRAHRSTLLFVNSRRVAERLAAALNELAGETLVRAHHGSLARAQRIEVEDALKAGTVRGLVATSSLELGIDMGAIDLVVQIEAPPSVASGLQRIGRAGHQVGAPSRGVIFPKYRGDLVACAAAARAMHEGEVEATRYPRNPLDVLAQQIVAMVGVDRWSVDELYAVVRRAAPFAECSRTAFEGVLDMLSGRYPSDDFAELRPRLTWDRLAGLLTARDSTRRVAIVNGGTIPDRGLYGVFLADGRKGTTRVGELDEEMVFESRVGETFVLGASTWRIEEITHDRVLVAPAPGEPGKMPFWKGETATRPVEFGRAIGVLVRTLDELPAAAARERLVRDHDLDPQAAENLLAYLHEQKAATGVLPDDRTVVVERCRDELGDWRLCVMSPFGGQVLAPWSLAAVARVREETGLDVEAMWTNDGFILRFPETDDPPDVSLIVPPADDAERLVIGQLAASALFAARFRECAGRALLLPRRRPGQRSPLWQQRKKASDLLAVASRFPSFPLVLEAHRECLRDLFDMPALRTLLAEVRAGQVRVITMDSTTPSPFAASLLFGYVANYLYDGDAPLAERRAQALSIDQDQLRDLLGDAELRELLDADVMADVERRLQHLDADYRARSVDGVHDLLLRVGDLTREEIVARSIEHQGGPWAEALVIARRAVELPVGGARRLVAVEDVARYRDGLGIPLPPGVPESLLTPVEDPLGDLVMRYARTHAPFSAGDVAGRYALGHATVEPVLHALTAAGRLLEGAFKPGHQAREWCAPDVLSIIRRHSLARLRREIEPVDSHVLARFLAAWQGTARPRRGLDAILDAVEHLQGAPLVASLLETRDPAGPRRGFRTGPPRHAPGGGRGRVGRARGARRSRRAHRALSHGPHGEAVAAPGEGRGPAGPRAGDPRAPGADRRVVLCADPRGGRWRVPRRHAGGPVAARVARARHQRCPPRPAAPREAARARSPGRGAHGRTGVPVTARRAAVGRGSVVARRGEHGNTAERYRLERRDGPAAPDALRHRHPRGGRRRSAQWRLQRRLRRAAIDGGAGAHPAGLLRLRRRGHAVCDACGPRPAALPACGPGRTRGRPAVGDRPGQPVWRVAQVARGRRRGDGSRSRAHAIGGRAGDRSSTAAWAPG